MLDSLVLKILTAWVNWTNDANALTLNRVFPNAQMGKQLIGLIAFLANIVAASLMIKFVKISHALTMDLSVNQSEILKHVFANLPSVVQFHTVHVAMIFVNPVTIVNVVKNAPTNLAQLKVASANTKEIKKLVNVNQLTAVRFRIVKKAMKFVILVTTANVMKNALMNPALSQTATSATTWKIMTTVNAQKSVVHLHYAKNQELIGTIVCRVIIVHVYPSTTLQQQQLLDLHAPSLVRLKKIAHQVSTMKLANANMTVSQDRKNINVLQFKFSFLIF
jgi:hypothetical protein